MSITQEHTETNRSTFVTVLAWIFIVLSGFSTIISVLQNIMVQTMFSTAEMHGAMAASNQIKDMPFFAQFMVNNFHLFFAAIFVLSASTFVSSVGLLKRKNWARLLFISIMALGIAWNIGGLALQFTMISSMSQTPSDAPAQLQSQVESMAITMVAFTAVMAIGFSALFGWVIKRLVSLPIQCEFQAERSGR